MPNTVFSELRNQIAGQELDLARQLGLTVGHEPGASGEQLLCRICSGQFQFRSEDGVFLCREDAGGCGFEGDLVALVGAVRKITQAEAFDVVADAVGYNDSEPTEQLANDESRPPDDSVADTDFLKPEDLVGKQSYWPKLILNTKTLADTLEALRYGIPKTKPTLHQSDCVVFSKMKDGTAVAYTFSGQVFATTDCEFPVEGATDYEHLANVFTAYGVQR